MMRHSGLAILGMALVAALLILLVILLPGDASAASTNASQDMHQALYGIRGDHPLVLGGVVRIPSPGDALITRSNGNGVYLLIDHLGSSRMGTDTSGSTEYAPYGRIPIGNIKLYYAHRPFDASVGTYDFLARQYDASLGQFLSNDPLRGVAGPYAYAGGDPIGRLDPDGLAPINFFLYSKYGTTLPDSSGRRSLRRGTKEIIKLAESSPSPVVFALLEKDDPVVLPEGEIANNHIMISSHGRPGLIDVVDPATNRPMSLSAEEFAPFLRSRIEQRFGDGAGEITRGTRLISFTQCSAACRRPPHPGPSEDTFIRSFANASGSDFPRLQEVVGSPYVISTSAALVERHHDQFELGVFPTGDRDAERLGRYISPDDLFAGRYPIDLFRSFHRTAFNTVKEYWPAWSNPSGRAEYTVSSSPSRIQNFMGMHAHQYLEPTLSRIPVPPPRPVVLSGEP